MLQLAELPLNGQTYLYDGRTGERFERKVTVGYLYMLKLKPPVDDKMHRALDGALQPGHAATPGRQGPVRWPALRGNGSLALEAYGAAYTLQGC